MKRIFTLLILVFTAFSFTKAADIIVTNFSDNDGDTGNLRDAVANSVSGDVIKFNIPAGLDELWLNSNITISGAGKSLTIDGMNMATDKPIMLTSSSGGRIFSIGTGAGNDGLNVIIKNVIIQDVQCTTNGAAFSSGNSAYTAAGAIKVRIENCYIKNCISAIPSTSSSGGGGVYFVSHGSDVTAVNCTFEGNMQQFSDGVEDGSKSIGGGVFGSTGNNTAKLAIINCTFKDNTSDGRGGALFLGHPTDIINCTFVNNTAPRCGGIYFHNAVPFNVVNTIAINNVAKTTAYGDIDRGNGTISVTYSMAGVTNLTEANGWGAGNITFLGSETVFKGGTGYALDDNGGPTPTIALASNSVVLNKGTAASGSLDIPTTDQRGAPHLTPPSMGAYDNPDYVFAGVPTVAKKQALTAWGEGKQIKVYAENPGWATVYGLTGGVLAKVHVDGVNTVATVESGIYLVSFEDNAGKTAVAKVVVP